MNIDLMLGNARIAAAIFAQYSQEQTDKIVKAVYEAGFKARVQLAKEAVEETGMGKWQDKVMKNVLATQLVYEDIKNQKTVGIISEDLHTGITEWAQPMGTVLAVIPVTNPTSTTLFKALISLKARNPIIICPPRRAARCTAHTAEIIYEAALAAGAPDDCVQCVEAPSRETTQQLMGHPDISVILATGGQGLVHSAYSSGTPAFGVGAGNVPVYVDSSADMDHVAKSIVQSKTFDYGTICASEQAVICQEKDLDRLTQALLANNAAIFTEEESEKIAAVAVDPKRGSMNPAIVGQPALKLAELAGVKVPPDTQLLVCRQSKVGDEAPLSQEILAPVIALYALPDEFSAMRLCIELNHYGGVGHTAAIYCNDDEVLNRYASLMNAGRILVNVPSSHGAVGGFCTMLEPSLTLGCGTGGGNTTTDNITARHLLNIQRVARPVRDTMVSRIPVKSYLDEFFHVDEMEKKARWNY